MDSLLSEPAWQQAGKEELVTLLLKSRQVKLIMGKQVRSFSIFIRGNSFQETLIVGHPPRDGVKDVPILKTRLEM